VSWKISRCSQSFEINLIESHNFHAFPLFFPLALEIWQRNNRALTFFLQSFQRYKIQFTISMKKNERRKNKSNDW